MLRLVEYFFEFHVTFTFRYGKRGVPWHITHVTARNARGYRTRLYVHAFDYVAQDAYTVISILDNVLHCIKQEMISVQRVFLRSDNAGSYKSALTITAIPALSKKHGLMIKRWDFSEAQAGKGTVQFDQVYTYTVI